MTDPTIVFGLDVGGTKILGVVSGTNGVPRHRIRAATPDRPEEVLGGIMTMIDRLTEAGGPPAAIGVGLPGLVDEAGVLRYGPNLPGVVDLDVHEPIGARHRVPLVVENDAACAVLAEVRLGAALGSDHVILVTQGTGIGAGIVVDGRLLRGANGFAAEPGHMMIDPAGPRCACGADGCWEALASGAGLVNLAKRLIEDGGGAGIVARAGDLSRLRGEHVAAAQADGDPEAVALLDAFAGWVARGLANLVTLLDPEIIVLGGGLSTISDRFIERVGLSTSAMMLGGGRRPPVPVVPAGLGAEAGAVGAALLAADAIGKPRPGDAARR